MPSPALPILDIREFSRQSMAEKRAIAHTLDLACRHTGFFYLTGYPLSPDLIAQMFAQSQSFFAQPLTAKQQSNWTSADSNRGYGGLEREQLNPDRPYDFKETFNLGWEAADGSTPKNPWPTALPEFRPVADAFYQGCIQTAQVVFEVLAIALDLPPQFFIQHHSQNPFTLRLLHYPAIPNDLAPDQLRAGEHTDYGTITLLFQHDEGGLEVQTTDRHWLLAPALPNTLLVNLGDLMARWTNQRYRSTLHRVNLPKGDRPSPPRYSIAFFCDANPSTEVACLPSCQSPEYPPLYPPILAGDYLISRLNQTYQY